jgi:hypothetical protein
MKASDTASNVIFVEVHGNGDVTPVEVSLARAYLGAVEKLQMVVDEEWKMIDGIYPDPEARLARRQLREWLRDTA